MVYNQRSGNGVSTPHSDQDEQTQTLANQFSGKGVSMPHPDQDEQTQTSAKQSKQCFGSLFVSAAGDLSENKMFGNRSGTPRLTSFVSAAGDLSENKMFGNRNGTPRLLSLNEGAAAAPRTKYHMESDIFGTGMSPNHSTHNKQSQTVNHNLEPTLAEMEAAGQPSVEQRVDWFGDEHMPVPVLDVDYESQYEETHLAALRNSRENSGNPITGEGYEEEEVHHSRRRQFTHPSDAKLW